MKNDFPPFSAEVLSSAFPWLSLVCPDKNYHTTRHVCEGTLLKAILGYTMWSEYPLSLACFAKNSLVDFIRLHASLKTMTFLPETPAKFFSFIS